MPQFGRWGPTRSNTPKANKILSSPSGWMLRKAIRAVMGSRAQLPESLFHFGWLDMWTDWLKEQSLFTFWNPYIKQLYVPPPMMTCRFLELGAAQDIFEIETRLQISSPALLHNTKTIFCVQQVLGKKVFLLLCWIWISKEVEGWEDEVEESRVLG